MAKPAQALMTILVIVALGWWLAYTNTGFLKDYYIRAWKFRVDYRISTSDVTKSTEFTVENIIKPALSKLGLSTDVTVLKVTVVDTMMMGEDAGHDYYIIANHELPDSKFLEAPKATRSIKMGMHPEVLFYDTDKKLYPCTSRQASNSVFTSMKGPGGKDIPYDPAKIK